MQNNKTEIEARFLQVNKESIRQKIEEIGAKLVHKELLMRRKVYDVPGHDKKWIRIRDEGIKKTITVKTKNSATISGTQEIEIETDNFEKSCDLIEYIGFVPASYQENLRETWQLGEVMITIDTWPGLEPVVEIEGPSESIVHEVASKLGFDMNNANYGSIDTVYKKLLDIEPDAFQNIKELTFDNFKK